MAMSRFTVIPVSLMSDETPAIEMSTFSPVTLLSDETPAIAMTSFIPVIFLSDNTPAIPLRHTEKCVFCSRKFSESLLLGYHILKHLEERDDESFGKKEPCSQEELNPTDKGACNSEPPPTESSDEWSWSSPTESSDEWPWTSPTESSDECSWFKCSTSHPCQTPIGKEKSRFMKDAKNDSTQMYRGSPKSPPPTESSDVWSWKSPTESSDECPWFTCPTSHPCQTPIGKEKSRFMKDAKNDSTQMYCGSPKSPPPTESSDVWSWTSPTETSDGCSWFTCPTSHRRQTPNGKGKSRFMKDAKNDSTQMYCGSPKLPPPTESSDVWSWTSPTESSDGCSWFTCSTSHRRQTPNGKEKSRFMKDAKNDSTQMYCGSPKSPPPFPKRKHKFVKVPVERVTSV